MTDASPRATSTVSARLDALPFTRAHLKVLTGSGLGWALDAMDVGLVSFVLAALIVSNAVSARFDTYFQRGIPPFSAPPPRMREASTQWYSPLPIIVAIAGISCGVYW